MSPVKDIHLMSDDEVTKLVGEAHNHVKQVHGIDQDHSEFDRFLQMHPYYADAVAEYKRRNLGEPMQSQSPDYPDLRKQLNDFKSIFYGPHPCEKCGVIIVKKSREQGGQAYNVPSEGGQWESHVCSKSSDKVPEGSGEKIPLTAEKLPSEEVPAHEQEAAIKKEEPNITDAQLKEEVATRQEEADHEQGAGEQ